MERPGPAAIRAELLLAVGADPLAPEPVAALSRGRAGAVHDRGGARQEQSSQAALAAAYHHAACCTIAARDLTGIKHHR